MIVVEGKIRGKERPRFSKGHTYTPNQTQQYEDWVKICYQHQGGKKLMEGALKLNMIIYHHIPKSWNKTRRERALKGIEVPMIKPDIDNIIKIILDSLNKIAYLDDTQVIKVEVEKRYTDKCERIEFELVKI